MQLSNRTELCDATRNKKQCRFETHLGSDATLTKKRKGNFSEGEGKHDPRQVAWGDGNDSRGFSPIWHPTRVYTQLRI